MQRSTGEYERSTVAGEEVNAFIPYRLPSCDPPLRLEGGLCDATVFSVRLFERLPEHPILTVNRVVELLGCSRPAAAKALRVLEAAEVLRALDERKKNRSVVFEGYLRYLRQGTE